MSEETKEVALSNPKVTNSVDLHLNQNDLIDIAIQEKLAIINAKIKESEAALKEVVARKAETSKKMIEVTVEKVKKANKGYAQFLKACKILKLDSGKQVNNNHQVDMYKSVEGGTYPTFNMNQAEDSKDPLRSMNRSKSETRIDIPVPTRVYLNQNYYSDEHGFSITYRGEYTEFSKAQKEAYVKKMKPIVEEEIKIKTAHFNIMVDYMQYQYGEKRIKAQIMRKSLSKSAEGRGILKMLEDATQIKVLG